MGKDSDKLKQVSFIGAWRTQQVTDQLLRQISKQISSKKNAPAHLKFTVEGLELIITNAKGQVTRHEKIELENIVDFIDNKYSTTCTLAIVRSKQQQHYTVFVFICKSDGDAAELVQVYQTTKRQLRGEGYNTDLTPKGVNWTLQQKDKEPVHRVVNGDVRVITQSREGVLVNTAERQNGGVTFINNDMRHDSFSRESIKTSSSDVQEELHHLANEVRDIKRILQGSKGREHFENHHGYRILQNPPSHGVPTRTEYVARDTAQPIELKREPLYVQHGNVMRYPDAPHESKKQMVYVKNGNYTQSDSPQVINVSGGGGISRNTRRYKSTSHYVTSSNTPTRVNYTKRVYDSTNPHLEAGTRVNTVRMVKQHTQPMLVPMTRQHITSYSSDIVHKSIEDVYKSRSSRRLYLPPPPGARTVDPPPLGASTVEYAHNDVIHLHQKPSIEHLNGIVTTAEETVHTPPGVRSVYENTGTEVLLESESLNEGTHFNISTNGNINGKMRMVDRNIDSNLHERRIETDNNVIVVKATGEISRSTTGEEIQHVIHDESSGTGQHHGGQVYYVGYADDSQKEIIKDDNVIVMEHKNEVSHEHVNIIEHGRDKLQTDVYTVSVEGDVKNIPVENAEHNPEDTGLFGAYITRPDDSDENENKIIEETVYRYHEDEEIHTDENKQHANEIAASLKEKHVRYEETVEQIPTTDNEYEHHETGVIVAKLRNSFNGKEINVNEEVDEEDDDNCEIDLDALKAYTMDPDIVIVGAGGVDSENVKEEDDDEDDDDDNYEIDLDVFKAKTMDPDIAIVGAGGVDSEISTDVGATIRMEPDVAITETEIIATDELSDSTEDVNRDIHSQSEDTVLF